MRRIAVYGVIVCALLLALPVATQEEEGNIAQVVWLKVKPGMEQQYEAGRKLHVEWHRQQNDTTTWVAWQVISGKRTGVYGLARLGHKWEEFDAPTVDEAADAADRQQNMAPYLESTKVEYWARLPNVSRPRPGEDLPAMNALIFFHVHYGKQAEFNYLIGKFHEAIGKTNWPAHYVWYVLVNGGEQPTYALVLPRANWAGFKPQETPFPKMLEEAYGRTEAEALLKKLGKVVRKQTSQIHEARPDLGYFPEGGM